MVLCLIRPTLEEIKRNVLQGKGGRCYTITVFMKYLLEALGYNVYFVAAKVNGALCHIAIIVTGVATPGDHFLFDPGLGYPNFEVIPFDFEVETEVYSHSYVKYKFVKEGECVVRYHKRAEAFPDPLDIPGAVESGWKKVIHIDLTPRELGYFNDIMDKVYTDVEGKITPLQHTLIISGFKERYLKPVIVKNTSLLSENDSHALDEVKANSAEEVLKVIEENYPALKGDVASAIKRLNLFKF